MLPRVRPDSLGWLVELGDKSWKHLHSLEFELFDMFLTENVDAKSALVYKFHHKGQLVLTNLNLPTTNTREVMFLPFRDMLWYLYFRYNLLLKIKIIHIVIPCLIRQYITSMPLISKINMTLWHQAISALLAVREGNLAARFIMPRNAAKQIIGFEVTWGGVMPSWPRPYTTVFLSIWFHRFITVWTWHFYRDRRLFVSQCILLNVDQSKVDHPLFGLQSWYIISHCK